MKKYILLFVAIFVAVAPITGFAARGDESEGEDGDCLDGLYDINPEDTENCSGWSDREYDCDIIYSCDSCEAGYELVSDTVAGHRINTCVLICNTSTNCISDTTWTNGATGYQRKINRSCTGETTCRETTVYRCAAGYFGSSTNGTSGCTRCPSEDGATGTSAAGSTSRTSCYMPSGTKFSNNTGSGQWTGNSYYCN